MASHHVCFSSLNRSVSVVVNASNQSNSDHSLCLINILSLFMFVVAFVGNTIALLVMLAPRRSLRLTNQTYLINLAIADLLRTCFIPFTIIARIKRNFIFGELMCKILPVAQGLSVSVEATTLICITIERYLAICHPLLVLRLRSLRYVSWFNPSMIVSMWIWGLFTASPNFFMHDLCYLPTLKRYKCQKLPSHLIDERFYMVTIDILYLVIPMLAMIFLYPLTIVKMSKNNLAMKMRSTKMERSSISTRLTISNAVSTHSPSIHRDRRKASTLLIVLIVEFFICWTPLYLYHTVGTFDKTIYRSIPPIVPNLALFLSFVSTSCNPITYYFMSQRFRTIIYKSFNRFYRKKYRSNLTPFNYQHEYSLVKIRRIKSNPI